MSVTTSPRTVETIPGDGGSGYGDLDNRRETPGRGRRWGGLLVAALIVISLAVLAFALFRSEDGETAAPTTTTSSSVPVSTATTADTAASPQPDPVDEPVEVEVGGWVLSNEDSELPQYRDTPLFYDAGTAEGDVEVGFVNSEIASIRALANPSTEEPELSYWKSGFTLRAARDVQAVLVEDGQVLLPGALTRVEIENITIRSETEADIEYCTLIHDYNVVVDNPDDTIETLTTRHAINRMTLGPDGQWQNNELISEIQVVDGPGSCLDIELTPVG